MCIALCNSDIFSKKLSYLILFRQQFTTHILNIFVDCEESFDDDNVNQLKLKNNLSDTDTILIRVGSKQVGGSLNFRRMTPEEFNQKIKVEEDRMILPNGLILLKSGKVIEP